MSPRPAPCRREFFKAAGLTGLGLGLPSALHALPARPPGGPIHSCILIFFYGGPSQLDSLDPKPDAPAEVRGEYGTIATAVPGVRVCEHLPQTARLLDRVALLRSLHHPLRNHNAAAAEALTGRVPAGGDQELLREDPRGQPTLGSGISYALGTRAHRLPYVALPYTLYNVVQLPGQGPGLLGGAYDRFQVTGDPNSPTFRIPGFEGADDLDGRAKLLQRLDSVALSNRATQAEHYRERALQLLASVEIRRLFDLSREPQKVRERYGRHRLGQSLLLARRLVEGGVNFVAAFDGRTNGQNANWDSHEMLFARHRQLLPPSDQAVSALIEDLAARGLLDTTLVIALGEFGRTPRINRNGGRDHWPDCYSVLLAGGGVIGGAVHGRSDKIGAYPAADPVTPADLAATIYWRFGIDPGTEIYDQTGRPFRLAEGEPIRKLFW